MLTQPLAPIASHVAASIIDAVGLAIRHANPRSIARDDGSLQIPTRSRIAARRNGRAIVAPEV